MNKTIEEFKEEISYSKKIKENLLNNLTKQKEREIILNIFSVEYDFFNKKVIIYYYVKDKDYPSTELSFEDFKKMIVG